MIPNDFLKKEIFKTCLDSCIPITLSYSPLAHMTDLLTQLVTLTYGGRVGFFSGNMETLLEDIQLLRPTELSAPPRYSFM
jgi:long-subunit acyl-CoA synthetase (AMP-forming)